MPGSGSRSGDQQHLMSGAAQCPSDSLRSRSCAHGAVNKQANLQLRQLTADRTAGRAGRPELRFWDTRSDRSPGGRRCYKTPASLDSSRAAQPCSVPEFAGCVHVAGAGPTGARGET